MTWALDTPEQRLRDKLRRHATVRHVCIACDVHDLRAVLDELDAARAALHRATRHEWHPFDAAAEIRRADEPL